VAGSGGELSFSLFSLCAVAVSSASSEVLELLDYSFSTQLALLLWIVDSFSCRCFHFGAIWFHPVLVFFDDFSDRGDFYYDQKSWAFRSLSCSSQPSFPK
jgi:hypothetical protein